MSERPFSPSADFVDNEVFLSQREQWFSRTKKRAITFGKRAVAATTVALSAATAAYSINANENRNHAAETSVSIETILDDPDVNNSLYFAGGLNSKNANTLASSIGPALSGLTPGTFKSVQLGDGAPFTNEVSNAIRFDLKETNPDSYSLYGNSLGGIEMIKTMAQIAEAKEKMPVIAYLSQTPLGIESLQPDKQKQVNTLLPLLSAIPYSEHSDFVKFILALGSDNKQSLADSVDAAWKVANDPDSPRYGILEYQINLAKVNLRPEFEKIAKASEYGPLPVMVIFTSENDNTVTKAAAIAMAKLASEFGIPHVVVSVNAEHNGFWKKEVAEEFERAANEYSRNILSTVAIQYTIYDIRREEKARALEQFEAGPRISLGPTPAE